MSVIAAHRVDSDHLVQITYDEDFGHDFPIYWVQVRNAQTVIIEMHERGSEAAAREMANSVWSRLRNR